MKTAPKHATLFYTIGHSTHSLEDLAAALESFHIKRLLDVRTIPKSGFNPQFNQETLAQSLSSRGIEYRHIPGLGGLRRPQKNSLNIGWRNASFRGYADYMQSDVFEKNLQEVIKEGQKVPLALMCAEALPWRCHRSLIADALLTQGFEVINIMGAHKGNFHVLNPMARVRGGKVYYPKAAGVEE
jgi:uncharacterized protein (DUF488 family)